MEDLLDKIKKVEALIEGAKTEGEKNAAISAKERILKKFPGLEVNRDPVEYKLLTNNSWNKRLLMAICRKYDVVPYRYKRQKYTTVMVRVNGQFLRKVLWPEYLKFTDLLENLVGEITDNLISKIHKHEDEDIVHGNLK